MRCPACNSSQIVRNEKKEIMCKKCGYIYSKKKKSKIVSTGNWGDV